MGFDTLSVPSAPGAIELRHLRGFVAVAEELNFGRAATRLYLSQPALSRQIRGLEQLVGCDLLRRSTHRVELTLAGEALLDRSRKLLGDLDDAISVTQSVSGELAGRIARLWRDGPLSNAAAEIHEVRTGYEALQAQFPPPPEVDIRPVNAGGVPSLWLTPQPDAPQATVLHLHGGGYVAGSAYGYRPLVGTLAAAANAGILLPDYRLAPEHPFPAALEDALSAYLWMLDAGTPPAEITVAGDSAGAGLSLSLMLALRSRGLPLPGRLALLCPWVELDNEVLFAAELEDDPALDLPFTQVRRFVDAYLNGHPGDDPGVNAMAADLTGLPPMLIQSAAGDPLTWGARRLVAHAQQYGVDTRLQLYPGSSHLFHLYWSFLPEAAEAIEQVGSFIREGMPPREP